MLYVSGLQLNRANSKVKNSPTVQSCRSVVWAFFLDLDVKISFEAAPNNEQEHPSTCAPQYLPLSVRTTEIANFYAPKAEIWAVSDRAFREDRRVDAKGGRELTTC